MRNKIKLISILFPLLALSGLVVKIEFDIRTGFHFKVPIKGYDPRDLLRGQYLLFNYDWNFDQDKVRSFFDNNPDYQKKDVRLCVQENGKVYPILNSDHSHDCKVKVIGQLSRSSSGENPGFNLGIEKFYLDENYAKKLEEKLRTEPAEVELSVNSQGKPVLIDLFFGNLSWKEVIKK